MTIKECTEALKLIDEFATTEGRVTPKLVFPSCIEILTRGELLYHTLHIDEYKEFKPFPHFPEETCTLSESTLLSANKSSQLFQRIFQHIDDKDQQKSLLFNFLDNFNDFSQGWVKDIRSFEESRLLILNKTISSLKEEEIGKQAINLFRNSLELSFALNQETKKTTKEDESLYLYLMTDIGGGNNPPTDLLKHTFRKAFQSLVNILTRIPENPILGYWGVPELRKASHTFLELFTLLKKHHTPKSPIANHPLWQRFLDIDIKKIDPNWSIHQFKNYIEMRAVFSDVREHMSRFPKNSSYMKQFKKAEESIKTLSEEELLQVEEYLISKGGSKSCPTKIKKAVAQLRLCCSFENVDLVRREMSLLLEQVLSIYLNPV